MSYVFFFFKFVCPLYYAYAHAIIILLIHWHNSVHLKYLAVTVSDYSGGDKYMHYYNTCLLRTSYNCTITCMLMLSSNPII